MKKILASTLLLMAAVSFAEDVPLSSAQPAGVVATEEAAQAALATVNHDADHEQLRAILKNVLGAMNAGNFADILPYFADDVLVTTLDQQQFTTKEGLTNYWKGLHEGAFSNVEDITFEAMPNDMTRFTGPDSATNFGACSVTIKWPNQEPVKMDCAWTVAMQRIDGQWKIVAFHSGANFMNNPVIDMLKKSATKMGVGGLIVGIIVGFFVGWMVMRRKA